MDIKMKEYLQPGNLVRYRCEITDFLDSFISKDYTYCWKHYIVKSDGIYLIRVPGGTLGEIHTLDNKILSIRIRQDYIIRTYPTDINLILKEKYVGSEIVI